MNCLLCCPAFLNGTAMLDGFFLQLFIEVSVQYVEFLVDGVDLVYFILVGEAESHLHIISHLHLAKLLLKHLILLLESVYSQS